MAKKNLKDYQSWSQLIERQMARKEHPATLGKEG